MKYVHKDGTKACTWCSPGANPVPRLKKEPQPELIVWGVVSTEGYCTLHENFDPECTACVWARELMQRTAVPQEPAK